MKTTLEQTLGSYAAGSLSMGTLLSRLRTVPPDRYPSLLTSVPDWGQTVLCFGFEQASLNRWRSHLRADRPDTARLPFSTTERWFADDLAGCGGQGVDALSGLEARWSAEASAPARPLASAVSYDARVRLPGRALVIGRVRVPVLSSWWQSGALTAAGLPRRGATRPATLGAVSFVHPGAPVSYQPGDLIVTVFRPSSGVYATFGRGAPLSAATVDGDVIVRAQDGRMQVSAVTPLGAFHPPLQVLVA